MVPAAVLLRVRGRRHRSQRVRGPGGDRVQLEAVARSARRGRQEHVDGEDRRHQAAGGRLDGRVLRRAARGRHQEEPQPHRRVQELAAAPRDARQERAGRPAGRAARRRAQAQEHRGLRRRRALQGPQQPALSRHQKTYMSRSPR